MYIPETMKNKIAEVFYDKEIELLTSESTLDEEGGVKTSGFEVEKTFMGNANYSNCKKVQEDYGLDYDINIVITTKEKLNLNDTIRYENRMYRVADFLPFDSHNMIVGVYW